MSSCLSSLIIVAGLLLSPWPVQADTDHDRVRAAMLAGEILPLPALLERVAREHPGHVLEVELEREHGRWIYELKILQAGGGLLKLEVDAKDAAVLKRQAGRL
uniref:PepSY domain-containing protein n=1 Tax=Hylemonella sp. TaxID=2066020 RepID=UPI0035AE8440